MYLAEGTGLTTSKGEPFFMSVEGQPSSSGLVNDIVLTNAYDMEYPTDLAATPELKFTLVGLENVTGVTIPSITDATQVMDWNACGLDKVTVKATMTYQGVPVDENLRGSSEEPGSISTTGKSSRHITVRLLSIRCSYNQHIQGNTRCKGNYRCQEDGSASISITMTS